MRYNIPLWEKKLGKNAFVGWGQSWEVNSVHVIESMQSTP